MAWRKVVRDPPTHPDLDIAEVATPFSRFLRLDVVRFRHRLYSGAWSGERLYDVVRVGDAVAVVLYDPDSDRLVFVEQLRIPPAFAGFSPWQLETVAGLVEPGEPDEAVARRETQEEAGAEVIGDLIPIQRYVPTTGSSDEAVMLFCGRVDASRADGIHGMAEEHEDIRVVVKSWAEMEAMVDAGQIDSGHTLLGLYWLLRHRDEVRLAWGFE